MAFYVPLGPRGGVFRLGTFLIGVMGRMAYKKAYRRRDAVFMNPTLPPAMLDALLVD